MATATETRLGNLVREGSSEVMARYCLDCGRVYGLADAWAGRCCHRPCENCGVDLGKSPYTRCEPCRATKDAADREARIAKAVRVSADAYEGPVYYESGDCYFPDHDEFVEWWEDEHSDPVPAVFACTATRLRIPSAEEIVESATENSYEDAADDMPDTAELQAAIDTYNARITAEEWEPDWSRVVVTTTEGES